MRNIAVIPNVNKDTDLSVTAKVVDTLTACGAVVYLEDKFSGTYIKKCRFYSDFPSDAELIVVVGGDGSMLDASVVAIEFDIPIIGVNMGKVGYLSEVEPDNLEVFKKIFDGNFKIEEKMLLYTELSSGAEVRLAERLAVNDVVISHDSYLGIAEFTVCGKGGGVRYRADGIVISTPQGSTAYSLSAGGPIVSHDLRALLVTPVCPHSFFDRSIMFSPTETIRVRNTGNENLNISIDGRCFGTLSPSDECIVGTSEKHVKVMTFKESNMFSTLFEKMRILEDVK